MHGPVGVCDILLKLLGINGRQRIIETALMQV